MPDYLNQPFISHSKVKFSHIFFINLVKMISEINLNDLKNEHFFRSLREGGFVLVLGAGFSFGLKNATGSSSEDEMNIPISKNFVRLTNRLFETNWPENDFHRAADTWFRKTEEDKTGDKFEQFRRLFLLDETEFARNRKRLYQTILAPYWSRIYTFNFDNVLDVLIQDRPAEYDVQYYDVGSFRPGNKTGIGYLHNSILRAKSINDLVFTKYQYAEKISGKNNHLYYALFNDLEKHGKNLLIIGTGFAEDTVYQFLHSQITRNDLSIIHINYDEKPNYGQEFENKVQDIRWVNCTTEEFLRFLQRYPEETSRKDPAPDFVEPLRSVPRRPVPKSLVRSFSDFLDGNYLRYYSREEYKAHCFPDQALDFKTENDFINLLDAGDALGLIIHGQGGIGKTRLMLELGRRLMERGDKVLRIHVEFEAFHELLEYIALMPETRFILLFDYIEEQKVFDKVIRWMINEKTEQVRIIGNCRNTYVEDLKVSYADYFHFVDIGFKDKLDEERKMEQRYLRKVILSIVHSIPDRRVVEYLLTARARGSLSQARPAYAAFIKYLYSKNPRSKINILDNENFIHWLIRKIQQTLGGHPLVAGFYDSRKYIFYFLSCLPSRPPATRSFFEVPVSGANFSYEINRLIRDGWIDSADDYMRLVHDTVADILLLEFFKYYRFRERVLEDLLDFAWNHNSASSVMWSLQRIWDEIPEEKQASYQITIGYFIRKSINATNCKDDWFRYKIDNTRLINELDRIRILIEHRDLLSENSSLEKFGSSLAYAFNWVRENIADPGSRTHFKDELYSLYHQYWNIDGRFNEIFKEPRGGKIISSYINLFGIDEHISGAFRMFIQEVPFIPENYTSLSITVGSWLYEGDPKLVETLVPELLQQPINRRVAYYILSHWLSSGYKPQLIKSYLEKWLIDPEEPEIIPFIFSSWLKKGDDANVLTQSIKNWFMVSSNEETKGSILCDYMEAGGDYLPLIAEMNEWLINNYENSVSVTLLGRLLEINIDKSFLVDFEAITINVLRYHQDLKEIGFIIGYWIEIGGNLNIIRPRIESYFREFGRSKQGIAIAAQWLHKGGESEYVRELLAELMNSDWLVRDYVILLLNWILHSHEPEFVDKAISNYFDLPENQIIYEDRYLITNWLEKTQTPDPVRSAIRPWLDANSSRTDGAIRVCSIWLRHGDDPELVRDYVARILPGHTQVIESFIVINNWLDATGDWKTIGPAFLSFLSFWAHDLSALSVGRKWLEKDGSPEYIKSLIKSLSLRPLPKSALLSSIIKLWLKTDESPDYIKPLVMRFLKVNSRNEQGGYVLTSWINRTGDVAAVKKPLIEYLDLFVDRENDASFILEAALVNDAGFKIVYPYLMNWLNQFGLNPLARYPLSSWLKLKGNEGAQEADQWILNWAERHYNPGNHNWRDELLLDYALWSKRSKEKDEDS